MTLLIPILTSLPDTTSSIDFGVSLESGVDVDSLIASNHIPSRLLFSRWECKEALMYTSLLSDWKVLLFNDIRDAINFKQCKDAYYLCVSSVERLHKLGWSLPLDINPDMTRTVASLDTAVEYACVSLPFVNLKDTNAIKIFVEYYQRDEQGGCICPPLSLSDREYLFHSTFTPTLPQTPSSSGTVDGNAWVYHFRWQCINSYR